MTTLVGGIEAGGTKFVCVVGTGPEDIRAQVRIPTTTPEATLGEALAFFQQQSRHVGPLAALGIASFGPLDLHPSSPSYGFITSTAKPGWRNVDLAGPFRRALGVPVSIDTDVNGAALGEGRWGAARGLGTFVYLTVGTGIGGGGVINHQMMHGLIHPEMGHIWLPRSPKEEPSFQGVCPYHGGCFEGLASGPALHRRWGGQAEALPENHPAWELEAHYISLALANFIATLSPQRIILGGGVMAQRHLYPLVRDEVRRLLNGYIQSADILERMDAYIVPPALEGLSGAAGALALAQTRVLKDMPVLEKTG
ncbi:ROK family protein [Stigmatella aurantiaca]|uniref:fructokinase n=1 Tax=Stigmatella aurantiaca (strain DW4/3-1) TaxID=378806 RepID=Q096C7_STIAD|nr:ROK family protein [Stigmatella aurantiaca]ADO69499.1 Fructokinase [Stigmatella aurantiaca DW4/3-1]EAU67597.1 fructokinase [Stigmatella aurantiaca DW4/3-1]